MPVHRFFRLKAAVVGFVLVLLMASAHGVDYIPSGQPVPENIRWVNNTSTGVNTNASAFYRNAAGQTTNHNFPVPISSSTIGNLAKTALRRGAAGYAWYSLAKGLIDGAGWAISELQNQVVTPASGETAAPGSQMWCSTEGHGCSKTQGGAVGICSSLYSGCSIRVVDGYMLQVWRTPVNGLGDTMQFNLVTVSQPTPDWSGGNPNPTQVSDQDLGNLLKQQPQIVNAVLIDPDTGAPIRTAELTEALNNLRRALEAANGTTPGTDLTPDPTPGETTTPSQTQWPGFCSWATVVCDFIDWVKKPEQETEPPEVPFEEQEMPSKSWTSGLGGGTCPAPESVTVSLSGASQTVQFEYEPICQLASSMRPVIIAMAFLLVPMIVGGFRSSKDA